MESNSCALKLNHLVFDQISFNRTGFKSDNDVDFQFGFNFDSRPSDNIIVHIRINAVKKDEYEITVDASGYFSCDGSPEQINAMTKRNAAAIIFPYIRSQLTLLSAQPEMEPLVLPPVNVASLIQEAEKNSQDTK